MGYRYHNENRTNEVRFPLKDNSLAARKKPAIRYFLQVRPYLNEVLSNFSPYLEIVLNIYNCGLFCYALTKEFGNYMYLFKSKRLDHTEVASDS